MAKGVCWKYLLVSLLLSGAIVSCTTEIRGEAPSGERRDRESSVEGFPVTGFWHVVASDLSIWAPMYAKSKELGFVTWKLVLQGDSLAVLEYMPSGLEVVGADPERFPYKKMRVEGARVDRRNRRLTFKVDRSTPLHEAYEAFELHWVDGELRGNYLVHDSLGGGPGTGPDYPGNMRLVRYGSLDY